MFAGLATQEAVCVEQGALCDLVWDRGGAHMNRTPSCMSAGRPDARAARSSAWQLLMMFMPQPSARRSRVASWYRSCADVM